MLPDDTCFFLAADFDKETWMDDVAAFGETCMGMNIPVAIERSRSGNGAHAWFFFAEPMPAATARNLGCYLLTETMSRRHQLSMESYDRLFPSQDTLTKGGFGNLIALPFQQEPRQKGNTVFLDKNFTPYADQWEYLASIKKLQPEMVHRLANEAIRMDSVVGVPRECWGRGGTISLEQNSFTQNAEKEAVVCPPGFDLRVLFVVNRTKTKILAFEELGLNVRHGFLHPLTPSSFPEEESRVREK